MFQQQQHQHQQGRFQKHCERDDLELNGEAKVEEGLGRANESFMESLPFHVTFRSSGASAAAAAVVVDNDGDGDNGDLSNEASKEVATTLDEVSQTDATLNTATKSTTMPMTMGTSVDTETSDQQCEQRRRRRLPLIGEMGPSSYLRGLPCDRDGGKIAEEDVSEEDGSGSGSGSGHGGGQRRRRRGWGDGDNRNKDHEVVTEAASSSPSPSTTSRYLDRPRKDEACVHRRRGGKKMTLRERYISSINSIASIFGLAAMLMWMGALLDRALFVRMMMPSSSSLPLSSIPLDSPDMPSSFLTLSPNGEGGKYEAVVKDMEGGGRTDTNEGVYAIARASSSGKARNDDHDRGGGGNISPIATSSFFASSSSSPSSISASTPSPALFLFVQGGEGTGHHLFMKVYRKSPSFRLLSSWGHINGTLYHSILSSLFNVRTMETGLWSAQCAPVSWNGRRQAKRDGTGKDVNEARAVDGMARLNETANALREMDRAIRLNYLGIGTHSSPVVVALGGIQFNEGRKKKRKRGKENQRKNKVKGMTGQGADVQIVDDELVIHARVNDTAFEEDKGDDEGAADRLRRRRLENQGLYVDNTDVDKEAIREDRGIGYSGHEAFPAATASVGTGGNESDQKGGIESKRGAPMPNVAGMLSYPNYGGLCRPLQYPDLTLLYDACVLAGVRCSHVYLSRDPYASLRSVVRRGFGGFFGGVGIRKPGVEKETGGRTATQMKVMQNALDVMRTQLQDNADGLVGCWDYDDDGGGGGGEVEDGGILTLAELLGWERRSDFVSMFRKMYVPSPVLTDGEKEILTEGGKLEPYMSRVVRSNERAVETCHAIYESNRKREKHAI